MLVILLIYRLFRSILRRFVVGNFLVFIFLLIQICGFKSTIHTNFPFVKFKLGALITLLVFLFLICHLLIIHLLCLSCHSKQIFKVFERFLTIPFRDEFVIDTGIFFIYLIWVLKSAQVSLRKIVFRYLQILKKLL